MIDANLWRQSMHRKGLLLGSCLCGILCAGVILGQAFTLAGILDQVFLHGGDFYAVLPELIQLTVLVTLRFVLQALEENLAFLLGQGVQMDLRQAMLQKIAALGPVAMGQEQKGQVMYLLNEGIGTLESYFSKYLPQLFQAAVIPLLFLCFILPRDLLSGVILLLTAPLVPFFMMLIGKWTGKVNAKQWKIINRLSGYLHDVMAGLTTLKLLNQSARQREKIAQVGEDYAQATLAVLRWAFLSSLALELFTTISIALVSVGLGLRLVEGQLDFATAFFILLAAPEFYQPLRTLGAHFHTSLNTREAAAELFAFLDKEELITEVTMDRAQVPMVELRHVSARYPGSEVSALQDISFTVAPGEVVALAGRSGSGKTTVLVNRIACLLNYGNAYHEELSAPASPEDLAFLRAAAEAASWEEEELQRVLQELALMAEGQEISVGEVEEVLRREQAMAEATGRTQKPAEPLDLSQTLDQINREVIRRVLAEEGGNQSRSAQRLGISRTTLWRLLNRQG